MNDFFQTVRSYLLEYLPRQRCYKENTAKSYRIALNLLVTYLRTEKKMSVSQIDFDVFDRNLILEYLDWLQETRRCSAATRNHRLMVLRAFFDYAGVIDCTQIALHNEVKKIPPQNTPGKIVEFLSEDALKALLAQPDTNKKIAFRNRFFMILMYETAARCDELLSLKVCDLRLNSRHPIVHLTGKGGKVRPVGLFPKTVEHTRLYLERLHPDSSTHKDHYLFYTNLHGPNKAMSIDTVETFVRDYGEAARKVCPELPERTHPHQLRHTRAIHLYRDGMPLAVLSEFMGHADTETTKIYAYADAEMKRAAMEKSEHLRKGVPAPEPIWKGDDDMILELSGLK